MSPEPLDGGDRPSRHGAICGEALAKMAEAGRAMRSDLPPECGTCAFRPGSLANQSAGTALTAYKCAIGVDPDRFACHHGMVDGEPQRLCAGFLAAKCAPWEDVKLAAALRDPPTDDPIRRDFDAWALSADPHGRLDIYELGKLYARRETAGEAEPEPAEDQAALL